MIFNAWNNREWFKALVLGHDGAVPLLGDHESVGVQAPHFDAPVRLIEGLQRGEPLTSQNPQEFCRIRDRFENSFEISKHMRYLDAFILILKRNRTVPTDFLEEQDNKKLHLNLKTG